MNREITIGQRIDVYEVVPNNRYFLPDNIWVGVTEEDSDFYVGFDTGDVLCFLVHTQLQDIQPECRKVGTMVIKHLKPHPHLTNPAPRT